MRKTFTYLSMLLVAMFSGFARMSAQTSFDVKCEQYPTVDYSTVDVKLSYEEVAKAAGYESAAAMQEAIGAVVNQNSSESTSMFWCNDSTQTLSNWNTQGSVGGFWLSADGSVVPWGNDNSVDYKSYFYTSLATDVDADEFVYSIGQFPDRCVGGTTYTATIYLKNGENTVTFNIELAVKKPIELPEATNAISKLNVIGSTDVTAEITYRVGTDFSVNIADIVALAGVEPSELSPVIEQMLMAWNFDETAIEGDCKTDTLMKYTQDYEFYFYVGDDETNVATATTSDLGDLWSVSDVWFDEESQSLVASVYPGNVETGNKFTTVLYVVYGDKAHQINLTVKVVEPTIVKPTEYEKVGEMELTLERNKDLGYVVTSNTIDVAAIAETLGCAPSEMVFMALNEDGGVDDEYTATPYPGFWMDKDGIIGSWGDSDLAWFACFDYSASTIDIGHMPDVFKGVEGEACTGSLYLVNGNKLYEIKTTLNIEVENLGEEPYEPIYDPALWTNVATEKLNIKIIPSSNFTDSYMQTDLDVAHIYELIADDHKSAITLYAWANEDKELPESYTCTPYPGYWMSADGKYAASYSNTCAFGFSYVYSTGIVTWYQFPNERQVGEKYDSQFVLVNLATGKMITYDVTISYVDKLVDSETVGEEDILVAVNDDDETLVEVDFTAAMEALGIEDESLLESVDWKAITSDGEYTTEAFDDASGFAFDADGNWLDNDDESIEKTAFYAGFILDGEKYVLTAYSMTALEDGEMYTTKLALDYNDQRYVYNLKLVNDATYTGISSVGADNQADNGVVYDLSGRVVRTNAASVAGLAKGVYILNGKKYIVK
ncbi:MAG: DUF4859 domain-containing protein [Bacteroides sp.]|nr:DUF4859 domain-containing protein [Roseburia sp.]MCM1347701.1 DUF4859 domain-containing protein [Bacteroides sp.]MCM1422121.1 DUF4859 domain-containing protein [Bacteroides sp.]